MAAQESQKRKVLHTVPHTGDEAASLPRAHSAFPDPAPQLHLFTPGQFALALSLQKSKPREISTQDYIHQLRKRIRLGQEEQHRHIDSADFWKDQYSTLLLEKNAWELKARSLAAGERDHVQPVPPESMRDVPELNYKPFTCIALLRQTQVLVSQLTDADIDALTLSRSLQTTLLHMGRLLDRICGPLDLLKPDEDGSVHRGEYIAEVVHTISLTYRQCLRGFNHLCRDIPGRQNKNAIIHGFSKLFSEILGYVHKMCEESVASSTPSGLASVASGTVSTDPPTKFKYNIINASLSKLLIIMIANDELNESSPGHTDILEGYLFHLLQHTGRTLSEVVFLEQVSTSGSGSSADPAKKEPNAAAQHKGRYLVYILSRVIKDNPKICNMLNDLPYRGSFTRGKKASVGSGLLSGEAKKRLQHTLLQGAFGGDDFKNSLKEPWAPESDADTLVSLDAREPEQFSTEWFVESLWSLIGWDMLSEKKSRN